MISIILPYWDRQAAADRALASLGRCYKGMALEVVVVDDGNRVPFKRPDVDVAITVVRLPEKAEPSSCITAWNRGVDASRSSIVVLSCIEVIHTEPVLDEMRNSLEALGPLGYVMAAAWCPDMKEWHCHSKAHSKGGPLPPKGFGRPFCAALYRGMFYTVGGFCEDYAQGVGYEDMDFMRCLEAAGARPKFRDDLVVLHPKAGAKIKWRPEMFDRNRAIYERRWA